MALRTLLFPEPPRRIPARRAVSIALRTAHLATLAVVLGGHVFAIEEHRLLPWLIATVASGAAMMALELAASFAWLSTGQGLAVLVKLAILGAVPLFWEHRVPILFAVVVLASVTSHMPARFRHRQFLAPRRLRRA